MKQNNKPKIVNSILFFLLVALGPVVTYYLAWAWLASTDGGSQTLSIIFGLAAELINPAVFLILIIAGWKIFQKRKWKGLLIEIFLPLVAGSILAAVYYYSPLFQSIQSLHNKIYTAVAKRNAMVIPERACYFYDDASQDMAIRFEGKMKIPNKELKIYSQLGIYEKNSLIESGSHDFGGSLLIDGNPANSFHFDNDFHKFQIDYNCGYKDCKESSLNVAQKDFFGTVFYVNDTPFSGFPFPEEFTKKISGLTWYGSGMQPLCLDLANKSN